MKKGFHVDIETKTISNTDFRRVLYTAEHLQLVLMSIKPGEEIGSEVHKGNDQFFRVEEGTGKVIISGETYVVSDGDSIIVPAGAEHNIINTSDSASLQLYTIYAPPHHNDGVRHSTKEEAEADKEKFDGETTE